MSIASQMERIGNNINNTYAVLASAGAEMPAESNSDNLPATAQTITAVLYGKAQTLTETQKSQARENIGALSEADISLGIASDGLIYIFVNGNPVGTGIPQGQSGDVFGYVDENNTIVLNGNLADGTYTVKYEMENGEVVNIGNMVLDSNVYYTVTSTLTNCVNSNSAKSVAEGGSYTATITAKDGYELKSVVVTMGGSPVSVSGGSISIANVTGDIVITAVAEEAVVTPTYTNLFVQGGDGYILNGRCSSTGADRTDANGYIISNYIRVANGDTVYVNKPIGTSYSGFKMSNGSTAAEVIPNGSTNIKNYAVSNGISRFTINNASVEYVRIQIQINATVTAITEDDVTNAGIIITVNEPIV